MWDFFFAYAKIRTINLPTLWAIHATTYHILTQVAEVVLGTDRNKACSCSPGVDNLFCRVPPGEEGSRNSGHQAAIHFPGRACHWVSGNHMVGQLDSEGESWVVYACVHSASWARARTQAEPAGETEVPLFTAGRLDSSQGMWAGDKIDDVGCIVYLCVMHAELKAEGRFYKSAAK